MALAKDKRRRDRLRRNRQAESVAKTESKARDEHRCRVPWCQYGDYALHSAHLRHKGMGGNPAGDRNVTGGLMTVCALHHREGPFALDKGTLRWLEVELNRGADGPVKWQARVEGRWLDVAAETSARHSLTTWKWQKLGSYELLRHLDRAA